MASTVSTPPTPATASSGTDVDAGLARRLLARHGTTALAVVALISLAVVHLVNIAGWPAFFDDEGTYLSQAWSVRTHGTLTPYTFWYDHPPLGWIQLAAVEWIPDLLFGSALPSVATGRAAMVAFTLVTVVLMYRLGRNLGIRPPFVVAATAIWSLSPLVIFEARQVFLDNIALPWLLGAFVLATSPQKRLGNAIFAGVLLAVAVLTKETMIIAAPALLWTVLTHAYRPARSFAIAGFTTTLVLTGAFYVLMAAVRGELLPGPDHTSLWAGLSFQVSDREGSGFILSPGSGAYGILSSWLARDALLIILGVASALRLLATPRLRPVALAALSFVALAMRPDGYLPFMYIIAVLPFFALAMAGVADMLWTIAVTRIPSAMPAALALLVIVATLQLSQGWAPAFREAVKEQDNTEHDLALAYLRENLPRDSTVVVDNTYWNDLVRAGWSDDGFTGAVWFYKVDQDPAAKEFIATWEDIDYLVWSPTLANDPAEAPVVRAAYDNSVTVAQWGGDTTLVQIRKVNP